MSVTASGTERAGTYCEKSRARAPLHQSDLRGCRDHQDAPGVVREDVLDRSTPLVICCASEAWGRSVAAAYPGVSRAQPDVLDDGLCAMESRLARRPLHWCVSGNSQGQGRLALLLTRGSVWSPLSCRCSSGSAGACLSSWGRYAGRSTAARQIFMEVQRRGAVSTWRAERSNQEMKVIMRWGRGGDQAVLTWRRASGTKRDGATGRPRRSSGREAVHEGSAAPT